MDINFDYYKIFYYVGKCKSITLAAEELRITQPAVSQGIKHLEESLGSPLFIRTSKGVRFTSEGEIFYQYISRGYDFFKLGEQKFLEFQNLESGEIRIGASDMTLEFFLLPYLEKFHDLYPGIKMIITNAPTPETVKHLQTGKIDFGVVSTPIEDTEHLEIQTVKELQDIFVAGKKFDFLNDKVLHYETLEKLPIVCLEGRTSTRGYVEQFLKKKGVVLTPEFELATSPMMIQFAKRSLGVASVVKDFAKESLENGEVFQLQFDEEIPTRHYALIKEKKVPLSKAAETFLRFIQEEA